MASVRAGEVRRKLATSILDVRSLMFMYGLAAVAFLSLTSEVAHREWAEFAVLGYFLAAVLAFWPAARPRAAPLVALAVAVALPLVVLVARGVAQPEVGVVRDGADHLWAAGTPYLAHPTSLYEYRPYLPALFVFGLLPGAPGDPRVVATLLLVASLVVLVVTTAREPSAEASGLRRLGGNQAVLALVLAFPPIALAIATSFIDVPQAALTILALALLARNGFASSGLMIGLTLAMKPTALCALFVLALTSYVRGGRRGAARFLVAAVVTVGVLVIPVAVRSPTAMWENVVLFPLGRADIKSPAASPFPGVLLRDAGVPTSLIVAVLAVSGVVYATWCVRARTSSIYGASTQLGGGLTIAFLMAPYSRAGYLVLPLLCWLPLFVLHRGLDKQEVDGK